MRPNLWQAYLNLQTSYAYGNGVSISPPSESQVTHALDWLRARGNVPRNNVLVIGPGRRGELDVLRSMAVSLSAVTAHGPEISVLTGIADNAVIADMHDMPFASGVFDFVYASNVFEHALAPYIALMECRRLLKCGSGGGEAYFVLPSFEGDQGGVGPFHLHCLDRDVWRVLLTKTGFLIVGEKTTPYVDGVSSYYHYQCLTQTPPPPHDKVLAEIVRLHQEGVFT